jgi:hypothetical protein
MKTANNKEAQMRHFATLASAIVALVIITVGGNAIAGDCPCDSRFTVHAGPAYNKCVDAFCKPSEPEVTPPAPTPAPTPEPSEKPCPYYMGKAVKDCPAGCPDKRMDIADGVCKCPKEMKTSKDKTSCVCTGGLIASGKRCVEPSTQPDCGTCQHVIEDLLGQTRFCDSQGVWYFSSEEYMANCKPCPRGTISTGWKCIAIPAGIAEVRGFFYWPPSFWDLLPLLLFIILLIIILMKKTDAHLKLKKVIEDFSRKELAPHRERLCKIEMTALGSRADELQFGLLPDLKKRLADAKKEEAETKKALEGGEEQLSNMQETVEITRTDLDNLNDEERDLLSRGSLTPEFKEKKTKKTVEREAATVALDQFKTVWANSAEELTRAKSGAFTKIRDLESQIEKTEKEIRDLRAAIAAASSEADRIRRASGPAK